MYKIKGFRNKVVCVVVFTFLSFMFVDQLLFTPGCVFSPQLTHAKNNDWQTSVINPVNVDCYRFLAIDYSGCLVDLT